MALLVLCLELSFKCTPLSYPGQPSYSHVSIMPTTKLVHIMRWWSSWEEEILSETFISPSRLGISLITCIQGLETSSQTRKIHTETFRDCQIPVMHVIFRSSEKWNKGFENHSTRSTPQWTTLVIHCLCFGDVKVLKQSAGLLPFSSTDSKLLFLFFALQTLESKCVGYSSDWGI